MLEYVVWQDETYVVADCAECGKSYSERIGIAAGRDELTSPEWHCFCGTMNEMKLHSDDCPCTMGGENVCELIGWFDDDTILEEEVDLENQNAHAIVKRLFARIHGKAEVCSDDSGTG